MSTTPVLPETIVTTRPKQREATSTRRLPPYHVILENDDYHSFEFVVAVLVKVLICTAERAWQLAEQAHRTGRSVVWTGPKEVAELKLEQMLTFRETRPQDGVNLGPLGCHIEPAPG